jgi:hypothetical protein
LAGVNQTYGTVAQPNSEKIINAQPTDKTIDVAPHDLKSRVNQLLFRHIAG